MAKGYWIARVDVNDPEEYKHYVSGAGSAFEEYRGKFLARGGAATSMEGQGRARNVVIEFESVDQAIACYNSPAYQEAMKHRHVASDAELIIVEGVEG